MRLALLLPLAILAAACGGGSKQDVPKNPPPSLASRCGRRIRLADGRVADPGLVPGLLTGSLA